MRQIFQYDANFGYRFVPGLKSRIDSENGGYLVRANSDGFRNNVDFETAKSKSKRILVFGDSFTAGDGVSNGKRYTDLLESDEREFYNFGLSGTGTGQQFLIFNEFESQIDHDLIVISVLVENIRRVKSKYRFYQDDEGNHVCYAKPFYELENGELKLGHSPVPPEPVDVNQLPETEKNKIDRGARFPLLNKILIKTNTIKLAHKLLRKKPYPEYDSPTNPAWMIMASIIENWVKMAKQKVLLVPIPFYYFIEEISDPTSYQMRFRELAETLGCDYHDPLPDLLNYSMKERREFRFKTDVHFSEKGHIALANSLRPKLDVILD